jgi:phosphoribosylanthranilate isomerase
MTLWVKICGITRPEDARAAFDAGADAIGINFWSGSRRFCPPADAREIVSALGEGELAFGVFVRPDRDEVRRALDEIGITGLQFHGGETTDEIRGWNVPTIRAVAAVTRQDVVEAVRQRDSLLEQQGIGYRLMIDHGSGGGSGRPIDESLLEGVDLGQTVIAGGLTPENVADRVARFRPFGVDTAGGVESAPGIKSAEAIEAFVRRAREPR